MTLRFLAALLFLAYPLLLSACREIAREGERG